MKEKQDSNQNVFTFEDAVSMARCLVCLKLLCMIYNLQHKSPVCLHECRYMHVCTGISVHMNVCLCINLSFISLRTSSNRSGFIKDQFNYCDKVSVGSIVFMVIISISILSPVGLKPWPIDSVAPHL